MFDAMVKFAPEFCISHDSMGTLHNSFFGGEGIFGFMKSGMIRMKVDQSSRELLDPAACESNREM